LQWTPFFAAQIAVTAAIINNFILNNQFTFKRCGIRSHFKSAAFFIGYSILMIGLQSNWVHLGVDYFGSGYLKENLIVASGVFVGSLLNYVFYTRVIWRNQKQVSVNTELLQCL
jgi:dolichol-phosphate mannosyltransferase